MLTIRSIAEREWASRHETNGPPPADLLTQSWVARVVRFICGPDPDPAYVPAYPHEEASSCPAPL